MSWDAELYEWIKRQCQKWEHDLLAKPEISRSADLDPEKLKVISVHIFDAARFLLTSAIACAIVKQS